MLEDSLKGQKLGLSRHHLGRLVALNSFLLLN